MKPVSQVLVGVVLSFLALLILHPAALAASRSVTVTVSCEIAPVIALAAGPRVQANTSPDYSVTEALVKTTQGNIKQISMTAL